METDDRGKEPQGVDPKKLPGTFSPKAFDDHTGSLYLIKEAPPPYHPHSVGGIVDTVILENAVRDRQNILLIGETGTGKSHVLRLIAYRLGLPYIRVQLYDAISAEDLFGSWIPSAREGFVWQDGVLTHFMRHGGMFVADELNGAKPGMNFVFHSITDHERRMTLTQRDGEVIYAHPDFIFCATMNPEYEGTKPLNRALFDRFGVVLEYDGSSAVGKLFPPELVHFKERVDEAIRAGELEGVCSVRSLQQYMRNRELFGNEVAKAVLIQKFEGIGKEAVADIMEAVGL
ncbi:MAG: AAA family ATPase [Deltaproteobacteria bacterium]|nr:AAA family ATPase [Deltaproteobacteria bacterium]